MSADKHAKQGSPLSASTSAGNCIDGQRRLQISPMRITCYNAAMLLNLGYSVVSSHIVHTVTNIIYR